MKENLNILLSIWLGIIGAFIGIIGSIGEDIFGYFRKVGCSIIEYSFKFDNF